MWPWSRRSKAAAPTGAQPQIPPPTLSAAATWLDQISERDGDWQDHGALNVPSGLLTVAPLGETGTSAIMPIPCKSLQVLTKSTRGLEPQLVWLQALETRPTQLAATDKVVTKAAHLAISCADCAADQTTATRTGRAGWTSDPGAVFAFPTGPHGYFDAAGYVIGTDADDIFRLEALQDADGNLSGLLIDLWGHKSGPALSSLLDAPHPSPPSTHS